MKTVDVLIIGQGLAGSTLAWRLAERGLSFLVVDRGGVDDHGRPSASRVAAGLLTPITGKRLTLSPDWAAMRQAATVFYRAVERATGTRCFHEAPSLRVFASEQERSRFAARRADPRYAEQAAAITADRAPAGVAAPHGGFWMPGAARLDNNAYLDATRAWLQDRNAFQLADVEPKQVIYTGGGLVDCPQLGLLARRIVFCQGCTESPGCPGAQQRVIPAAGETLRVFAPELAAKRVVHHAAWAAPVLGDAPGQYLVGSTYAWGSNDPGPTPAAREELLRRLAGFHSGPVDVLDQRAALRPTTSDRNPIVSVLDGGPAAFFNGLGTKGALGAPWHADRLASDLAAVSRKN